MTAADRNPSASGATAPKTVVFDLGGVLIDWNPRHLYRKLFEDEEAMESFLTEVVTPEWNSQQDAGRPWADALEILTAQHPEHRDLITAYWHRWPETLGDAIEPTVAILRELRDVGLRLIALSNWSAETFPIARPRYPFLEWFDGIVISGEVKVTKPDPRIFRHLLERYELEPGATVFVDDSVANVRAAEALGIIGITFEDAASLRRSLVALGLLGVVDGAI